ncbi:MAG: hypothetical protein JSV09_08370 [Thermoplasmata archaeon]|nr:MAG: hypothetical protein JSV09_08370 [Thermoplasmata archaeon]
MKKMITELDKLLAQGKDITKDDLKIRKKSTLMNASRCIIFEFLCLHPCSSVTNIAKGLDISESRVRWHLEKLIWDRYVSAQENGSTIFFPSNMINPDHVRIFRLLAQEKSSAILTSIKSREGLYLSELSRELDLNIRTVMKYTSDLEYLGIIRGANDGKFKRYYLTGLLDELKEYYRKNAKNFRDYFLKKAKMDALRPKIILSTPELLRLELVVGTKIRVLNIPLIPFSEVKQGLRDMWKEKLTQKGSLISYT